MTAFRGTYADWKLIKTRGVVQVIFEVPLADADAAYDVLGGMPVHGKERWFGIAALKSPAEEARATSRQEVPQNTRPDGTKRMDWRDMQPAAQAGIRCNDAMFRAFLVEEHSFRPRDANDPEEVAQFLRGFFNINSRVELGTDHRKRVLWRQLDDQFQAWKAIEHA